MSLGVDHSWSNSHCLLRLMESIGFQAATERTWTLPIGAWPTDERLKEVGMIMFYVLFKGAREIAQTPLSEGLGWDDAQVDALVASFRKGLRNWTRQPSFTFRAVYAQKPAP